MARHLNYVDRELEREFNCMFTSEFIEISKRNCVKGSALFLAIKCAVCIHDVNERMSDYSDEIGKKHESVNVWLRDEHKSGKSMLGKIKCPSNKDLHLEAHTSSEYRKVIDEISKKLRKEIKHFGIKLPVIEDLGFVRDSIEDKISIITGARWVKSERLVSPWFSIPNVSQYKFKPIYITHNQVGFTMSLSRLKINLVALRDTLKTCIKYNLEVDKINRALAKVAATTTDHMDNIKDKSILAWNQAYLGGLRSLHFNLPEAATSLYNQIKTWDEEIFKPETRDIILAKLGAKVQVRDGKEILVFTDTRRRSQSPPQRRQSKRKQPG